MGGAKHLLEIDGEPMLARVVGALVGSRAEGITVVLRPQDARGAALARSLGVESVWSEDAQEGRAASIRAGVRAAGPGAHLLFAMVDQPFLTAEDFDSVMEPLLQGRCGIVHASFDGVRGTPVAFSCAYREALLELRGSEGGRVLIARHADDARARELPAARGRDLDTPQDLQRR
jgi:CTP:molybdopterin cytidylyltransferase MocA